MMKKKLLLWALLAALLLSLASCGEAGADSGSQPASQGAASSEDSDQAAADEVAALIDAIYVQQWTEDTDAQCQAAKAGWDALTDAQKALVQGENASPDYFGLDTGDPNQDDPLNQDDIGDREILVVSFGTSYNDSRAKDIGGIEQAIQAAYPDWSVRRAFTSQIIINHIQARDGVKIDNIQQALDRAVANGVKELVVQPTHLMHGSEYDEMVEAVQDYAERFDFVSIAEPLLGEVGADAASVNEDKAAVARAVVAGAVDQAGYGSLEEAAQEGTAFVLLGHGTSHAAKISYSQMQEQLSQLGCQNVFVGTVEGEPQGTDCASIIDAVAQAGYTHVVLRPLMVVAGDHANNDMAGDEANSWKSQFMASGTFEAVDTQLDGLGSVDEIQAIYVSHTAAAMDGEGLTVDQSAGTSADVLADGVYTADFDTDSGMFHVNEALNGKGTLTVENGQMTIHVSLVSQNIVNLYPGKAEDAAQAGAQVLEPTLDTVTYSDGTTEQVYGFDVLVPALDQEFDLAILGAKGTWYDHVVSVSNPEPVQ